MKIVAKEDVEAPIDQVFDAVSDFRRFERAAIRKGARVKRLDLLSSPGAGVSWQVDFTARGRERHLQLDVTSFDAPERMVLEMTSPGMVGQITVDVLALSPSRTRLRVEAEMKPQTLSARLLIQSLRLARSNLQKRFQKRLADLASSIDGRPRRKRETV